MAALIVPRPSLDEKSLDVKSLDAKSLDAKSLDLKSLDLKSPNLKSRDVKSLEPIVCALAPVVFGFRWGAIKFKKNAPNGFRGGKCHWSVTAVLQLKGIWTEPRRRRHTTEI
jgi:hypothetical protein